MSQTTTCPRCGARLSSEQAREGRCPRCVLLLALDAADEVPGESAETIAARIGAPALGDEILASDVVYALARGLGTFTFGAPRTAALKGLNGSFELYPVLA